MDLLVSSLESIQNTDATLRAEVQLLKAEHGKLWSKLSHAEHHNDELAKLIETMSFPASSGSGTSNKRKDSPTLNAYPPASSIPGSLSQQPTALSFLIIRVLNNSPGHVLKATFPRDAVTLQYSDVICRPQPPREHYCHRYWQLHCPGSGTACPRERFWCMWLCFPWPHRPRNQRPHQAYPDDWRHCICGRHQQQRDSNYCRELQWRPANHWQWCAQETSQDRDHVPVTPSLW